MPRLHNIRRELFCQSLVRNAKNGLNMSAAYRQAGYKGVGQGMWASASRLLTFDEVKMRLNELMAPQAKKASVSLEALIERIGRAIEAAERDKAHGAVASNHALLLKIVEMVRNDDQAGSLAELADLRDEAQVVELMVDEMGIDYAIELGNQLVSEAHRRAADCAQVVPRAD
jgi:hypothetical protein